MKRLSSSEPFGCSSKVVLRKILLTFSLNIVFVRTLLAFKTALSINQIREGKYDDKSHKIQENLSLSQLNRLQLNSLCKYMQLAEPEEMMINAYRNGGV